MQISNIRYFIAIALMFLAFLCIAQIEQANSVSHTTKDFSTFPMTIGNWKGTDIELTEDVYEILQTRDVLVREYKDDKGDAVMIYIVYSAKDRATFHPPEMCYLGGGMQLLNRSVESITLSNRNVLMANALTMESKNTMVKAWYWFMAKDKLTHNYYQQQIAILFNWLKYRSKEGAMVRVSANIRRDNPAIGEAKVKEFIKAVAPVIEKFFKKT